MAITPSIKEVESIIAQLEMIRANWRGNPDYVRRLDIELQAMQLLKGALNHAEAVRSHPRQAD